MGAVRDLTVSRVEFDFPENAPEEFWDIQTPWDESILEELFEFLSLLPGFRPIEEDELDEDQRGLTTDFESLKKAIKAFRQLYLGAKEDLKPLKEKLAGKPDQWHGVVFRLVWE